MQELRKSLAPATTWGRRSEMHPAVGDSPRTDDGNGNEHLDSARSKTSAGSDDSELEVGAVSSYKALAGLGPASVAPSKAEVELVAARDAAKQADEVNSKKIKEYVGYLSKVPELKTLLMVEKRKIASAMKDLEHPCGHTISRQGDIGDTFYVLVEGSVRILENGVEVARLTADREQGIVPHFGEKALFLNQPRNATVVVASPTARLLALDRESFQTHLGPLEYFFGIHDENNSEEGDHDGHANHHDTDAGTTGDPFECITGGLTGSAPRVRGRRGDFKEDSNFIDNKLWALGMSQEQLSKSKIAKKRDKGARLAKWPPWRTTVYQVYHYKTVKAAFACFILVNTACLCVIVSRPPGESQYFEIGTILCKAIFAVELLTRIVANAKGRLSGWVRFELLIFLIAVIELVLIPFKDKAGRAGPALGSLQSLRLVRFLKILKVHMGPLRVILTALGSGLSYVLSAGFFVGMIWLTAAIGFTALLGNSTSDDPQVQHALDHFSSTGRSLLSALEMTVGGMCWGSTIFDPLIGSDRFAWHLGGVLVLGLVVLSSFLIWNLILGIYVRQVTIISKAYDEEEEQEALFDGENSVKTMRMMLENIDLDKDGCINRKELNMLVTDPEIMSTLRLGSQEVQVLHATLDAESNGNVSISDFLFGVLKLTGASKTLDMLSIDYRQKALLRCITQLEKSSGAQLDALSADLDALYAYAAYLDRRIRALHRSVAKAKADLIMEIERLGRLAERARRQALQNQMLVDARRKQENLEVRSKINAQLDSLHSEIEHLSRERQLQYLTAGEGIEITAIRKAVRERLDREVGPWLDRELASLKLSG